MSDFSLVPVDHQPDFGDVSFIPVDHDPLSADGMIQQARTQLESQPQRLAAGAGLPDVGAPAINPQAATFDASYDPDSASGGVLDRIAANDPSAAPIFATSDG